HRCGMHVDAARITTTPIRLRERSGIGTNATSAEHRERAGYVHLHVAGISGSIRVGADVPILEKDAGGGDVDRAGSSGSIRVGADVPILEKDAVGGDVDRASVGMRGPGIKDPTSNAE